MDDYQQDVPVGSRVNNGPQAIHIDKKSSVCDAQFVEQMLHVDANRFVVLIDMAAGFRLPAELESAATRQERLEDFISKHGYSRDCPKTLCSSR